MTTSVVPRSCASEAISLVNERQRTFGSTPVQTIRSRSMPGSGAWKNSVSGQEMCRVSPSLSETCGRVTWKST